MRILILIKKILKNINFFLINILNENIKNINVLIF